MSHLRVLVLVLIACFALGCDERAMEKAVGQAQGLVITIQEAIDDGEVNDAESAFQELRALYAKVPAPKIRAELAAALRYAYAWARRWEDEERRAAWRKEIAALVSDEGIDVATLDEWLEVLALEYEDAVVSDDKRAAERVLRAIRREIEAGDNHPDLKAQLCAAHAYAHYALSIRDEHDRTPAELDALRDLCAGVDTTEDQRDYLATSLLNEDINRRQENDDDGALRFVNELEELALRDAASDRQRRDLARSYQGWFKRFWDQGDRERALERLLRLEALVERGVSDDVADTYADTIDDWHWKATGSGDAEARAKALARLAAFADREGHTEKQRASRRAAMIREHDALREADAHDEADVLLEEMAALEKVADPDGYADLDYALMLRDAHRELGDDRMFDRADRVLTEFRRYVAPEDTDEYARQYFANALADTMWDVANADRDGDLEALLEELRALVMRPEARPQAHAAMLRGLRTRWRIATRAGDEGAEAYWNEARALVAGDEVSADAVDMYGHFLRVVVQTIGKDGWARPELKQALDELGEIAARDDAPERVSRDYSASLVDVHAAAERAGAEADALALLERARAWGLREGASEIDRNNLSHALFNRHYYVIDRGGSAEARAKALAAIREYADRADANRLAHEELIEALRRERGVRFEEDPESAKAVLDEIRARLAERDPTPPELRDFAAALAGQHADSGDARDWARCGALLDEIRVLARRPDATDEVRGRLATALADALYDVAHNERPDGPDALVSELRTLSTRFPDESRVRTQLGRGLLNAISVYVRGGALGTIDRALDELRALVERDPENEDLRLYLIESIRREHAEAGDRERYARTARLLDEARAIVSRETATDDQAEELSLMLANEIWDETYRERWNVVGRLLDESRVFAAKHPDNETVQGNRSYALRIAYNRYVWEERDEAKPALDALRAIVAEPGSTTWQRNELADALATGVEAMMNRGEHRAARRLADELWKVALADGASEDARGHLARAMASIAQWAPSGAERDSALRQLEALVGRDEATEAQRDFLAEAMADAAPRRLAADKASGLALVERLTAIAMRDESTEKQREAFTELWKSYGALRKHDQEAAQEFRTALRTIAMRKDAGKGRLAYGMVLKTEADLREEEGLEDSGAELIAEMERLVGAETNRVRKVIIKNLLEQMRDGGN